MLWVLTIAITLSVVLGLRQRGAASHSNGSGRDATQSLLQLLEDAQSERLPSPANSPTPPSASEAEIPTIVPEIPSTHGGEPALRIRVALLSQSPITSIRALDGATCRIEAGPRLTDLQLIAQLRSTSNDTIRCRGGRVLVNQLSYPQALDLIRLSQGWLAVNELDLELYIASVVGAEMPSHWHLEALKAQAVAARSYALVHMARPAAAAYNLGDTTRWQAYRGDQSRSQRTLEATRSTRGIILSYRGGIVESLYAATHTISAEAHGHLGASMSQHGARNLAAQGLTFNEILASYYRGAALARLRQGGG